MGSLWLIAGPTASGKSALALSLAEAVGGEIVNADSMQLYRDLPILTASPSAQEKARAPHHLYGVADGAAGWSVGRWLGAARDVLDEIAARGRPALVVGGTGLYFNALTQGLADIPAIPSALRSELQAEFDAAGESAFRARLGRVDPIAEARIAPRDAQRLVRALEVAEATGKPLSQWQAETRPSMDRGAYRPVVLEPPRQALYARCDARYGAMVASGALEEARGFLARGLDPALPLMKATGLRELGRHLSGELDLHACLELGRQETRRYAKRQSTWFRNQVPTWPKIAGFGDEVSIARLLDADATDAPLT